MSPTDLMSEKSSADLEKRQQALVAQVEAVAVLPHVVFRVIEATEGDDISAFEIESIITVDPGFCTKILAMANSAAFGLSRRVSSIREAVSFVGYRSIRSMAMTVGVFDMFVGKNDKESLRRRGWWRQSIDTAVCSQWLARKSRKVRPEDAYTCGLLHLIGKTMLDRLGGQDYETVLSIVELGVPDYLAERRAFGCDHSDLAGTAAANWNLPAEIQSGIRYISEPERDDPHAMLRATTAIGARIALFAREGVPGEAEKAIPKWALNLLEISAEDLNDWIAEGTAVVTEAGL